MLPLSRAGSHGLRRPDQDAAESVRPDRWYTRAGWDLEVRLEAVRADNSRREGLMAADGILNIIDAITNLIGQRSSEPQADP